MTSAESHSARRPRFDELVAPLLPAAYNLARWLVRDDAGAQDVVQEASLRAWRSLDQLRADASARPWLLGIVRNACFDWLRQQRRVGDVVAFDEALDALGKLDESHVLAAASPGANVDPAESYERRAQRTRVNAAIAALPAPFREVIVLREIEEMAYDEIAWVAGIPIGTVMSRLSRARAALRRLLHAELESNAMPTSAADARNAEPQR